MKKKLLLIDPDADQSRSIAARLRLRGLDCEVADSFLFALTNLEWIKPKVVVARDQIIDGMSPSEFCATIKKDDTLRAIPAVLIGTPGAFGAQAVERFDLLLDDSDPDRLAAQLAHVAEGGLEALDDEQGPERDRGATSTGASDPLAILAGLLAQLDSDLESGRLLFRSHAEAPIASMILDHGQVVHAVFGGLQGSPAFKRVVDQLRGVEHEIQIQFERQHRWQVSVQPRSINRAERQRLLDLLRSGDDFSTREFDALNLWREG